MHIGPRWKFFGSALLELLISLNLNINWALEPLGAGARAEEPKAHRCESIQIESVKIVFLMKLGGQNSLQTNVMKRSRLNAK